MALMFDGNDQGGLENGITNGGPQEGEEGEQAFPLKRFDNIEQKFGFDLEHLYKLAVSFYREKDNKAFHVTYNDRAKLAAYAKQVKYGKFDVTKLKDANGGVGFFDLVGNDRRHAWAGLGDLSKEEAMAGFVALLDSVCPQFRIFVEAQKRDADEKKKLESLEEEHREILAKERQKVIEEEFRLRADTHRQQIQEALNRQTYHQFRAYAEQQCPGNFEQQASLISQLQEQHYQQYMAQIYAQQVMFEQQQAAQEGEQELLKNDVNSGEFDQNRKDAEGKEVTSGSDGDSESGEDKEESPSNPAISPASMWTRKDIKEFKETIRKEGSEGVIKVGHGETVTVRVPTHEDGTCLFWEFATDNYDIGFGIYFEWTISETNTVSVHISESDDEDEDEVEGEKKGDVEGGAKSDKNAGKPQTDEIIPVYRRDCHEEVYAGSHVYPGRGVYLLKFDNSYSLWRSKSLYYRVYYSK